MGSRGLGGDPRRYLMRFVWLNLSRACKVALKGIGRKAMKKGLICSYSLVLGLLSTSLFPVLSAKADPDPQKQEAKIMLNAIKTKPLQAKTFRARMITSPNKNLKQVAAQVNQSTKPVPTKPAPTAFTPIINTVNDVQGRALNLGTDVVAFTLSPLPVHLERPQVEYVRDRTFEALTTQNLQLYKTQW